jgi:hypothetical protein
MSDQLQLDDKKRSKEQDEESVGETKILDSPHWASR